MLPQQAALYQIPSISLQTSVKGLHATTNLCFTAHISVLAVALAAAKSGDKHKLRILCYLKERVS